MRINKDHKYHGAALTQIAEHTAFSAINAFEDDLAKSRCAFRVNGDIGIYIKYNAKPPRGRYKEYLFTFTQNNLKEIQSVRGRTRQTYVVLVCAEAEEVCVISDDELDRLIQRRLDMVGQPEDQYQVLVTAPPRKSLRVYTNCPGTKGTALGEFKVSRSAFPSVLFS